MAKSNAIGQPKRSCPESSELQIVKIANSQWILKILTVSLHTFNANLQSNFCGLPDRIVSPTSPLRTVISSSQVIWKRISIFVHFFVPTEFVTSNQFVDHTLWLFSLPTFRWEAEVHRMCSETDQDLSSLKAGKCGTLWWFLAHLNFGLLNEFLLKLPSGLGVW